MGSNSLQMSLNLGLSFKNGWSMPVRGSLIVGATFYFLVLIWFLKFIWVFF